MFIGIYQIKDVASCNYAFRSYEEAQRHCNGIEIEDYREAYLYRCEDGFETVEEALEHVFEVFNTDPPSDYSGRSISVSDLLCIGWSDWYYVDDIGFTFLGSFEAGFFEDSVELKEFRICSECGSVMRSGFTDDWGDEYLCSKECLAKRYTWEEYLEAYERDEMYYTEWY